jgi:uncharacterized membrane-anchored protein
VRLATLRRHRASPLPGLTRPVRLDRRTKDLTGRLKTGDIAVIDHVDLDRVSAEALVQAGVSAVVNVAASISGRYPNLGPEILLAAGIPLVDSAGPDLFADLSEGQLVRLDEGRLYVGEQLIGKGTVLTAAAVAAAMADARAGLSEQIEAFALNTMDYVRRERDLLFDGVGVPEIRTQLAGRHALIVVRGYGYKADLASLRAYIREYRPVLVGVDGGADALREYGYKPDLIVGDLDSVSTETLRCGAEIVVHAYRDGGAPGLERVEQLGLEATVFAAAGTSEDVAMILADELGATLIVAVGTHATLVEFLDKGRAGMASTFLTRLRVGGKLVDAKGVSRLYRSRIKTSSLLVLILATLVCLGVALSISTAGRTYLGLFNDTWHDFTVWLRHLVR